MNKYTISGLLLALIMFSAACGEKNPVSSAKNDGAKYLEENAQKEGVTTTASGLQYEILIEGQGAKPTLQDTVVVHYVGTKIDGSVFDSSIARGEPATFPVFVLIEGWKEALLLMNTGSKYRLVIPPELAYGESGAGSIIGPNEVLIFEVELLEIL